MFQMLLRTTHPRRRSAARLRDDCAAHQRALAAVKRRSIKLGGPKLNMAQAGGCLHPRQAWRGVMDEVIAELERTQPAAIARLVRIITGSSGSVRPAGLPPQDPLLLKVGPGRTQARGIAAQKNKSKKSCLFLPVGI
jgi:hypothetical protein